MKPSLKIHKSIVTLTFDEVVVDYEVRFDITGKIYEAEPLFYDLPEAARRLILGDDPIEMLSRINKFCDLLDFLVPMAIFDLPFHYKYALADLVNKIDNEIDELNIDKNNLYTYAEKDSLAYNLLIFSSGSFGAKKQLSSFWLSTGSLFDNMFATNNDILDDIEYLNTNHGEVGFTIHCAIIPHLVDEGASQAFAYLSNYVDENCKSFLLTELEKEQNLGHCGAILYALSKQSIHEPEIQERLIQLYNSGLELRTNSKLSLIRILQHFPDVITTKIAKELVVEGHLAIPAAEILLNGGFPPQNIVSLLTKRSYGIHSLPTIYAIYLNPKMKNDVPDNIYLLAIFVKCLKRQDRFNSTLRAFRKIKEPLLSILLNVNQFNSATASKLVSYLDDENQFVRRCMLYIINELLFQKNVDSQPFSSTAALLKYLNEALTIGSSEMKYIAWSIFYKASYKNRTPEYLSALLEFLDHNKDYKSDIMDTINQTLERVGYNNVVSENYISALKDPKINIRQLAKRGLSMSVDPAIQKLLREVDV